MSALPQQEMVLSEAMLFQPILKQDYLQNEFSSDHTPQSSIQQDAPIEILVVGSNLLYINLNNTRFSIKFHITRGDVTPIPQNSHTSVVNNVLHSLFIEISMELNSKSVTDPNQLYPYRAYLENLLNFSNDVERNRLRAEGWIRDTDTAYMNPEHDANSGVAKRAAWVSESYVFEVVGRPHLDLFQQSKLIPPGINMLISCIPANDTFVIKTTELMLRTR